MAISHPSGTSLFRRRAGSTLPTSKRRGFAARPKGRALTMEALENRMLLSVSLRYEFDNLSGSQVNALSVGQDYVLKAFIQDEGGTDSPTGISQAYFNVGYNSALVAPSVGATIVHGPDYNDPTTASGDLVTVDLIHDAGSKKTVQVLPSAIEAAGEYLLFSVRLHAESPGTLSLTTSAAASGHGLEVFPDSTPLTLPDDLIISGNTIAVTIDMQGPVTSLVTAVPNPAQLLTTAYGSVSDAGTGDSAITAAEYFIDTAGAAGTGIAMTGNFGQSTVAVSGAVALTGLSEGSHTIYVRGRDAAGNWGEVVSGTFIKDVTPPTLTLGAVVSPTTNTTPTFSGVASLLPDASDSVTVKIYEGTGTGGLLVTTVTASRDAATGSFSVVSTALPDGVFTAQASQSDSADNMGMSDAVTFTVDAVGPTATATVSSDRANTPPTVSASLSETPPGTITAAEFFLDTVGANGSGTAFSGPFGSSSVSVSAQIASEVFAALSEGLHTIHVHGRAASGNWGATVPVTFIKDSLAPLASDFSVLPGRTSVAPTISGKLSDAAKGESPITLIEYRTDSGQWAPVPTFTSGVEAPFDFTLPTAEFSALSEGSHTVSVRGKDAAGNISNEITQSFVKDTVAPAISNLATLPSPTHVAPSISGTARDTGGGNSNVDTIEYAIDAGAWISISAFTPGSEVPFSFAIPPATFEALADGSHSVQIRTKDVAGNLSTVAETSFVKDTVAPETTTVSVTPTSTNVPPTISATVSDSAGGNNNIVAAEYFIDTVGADGTGIAMTGDWTGLTATVNGTMSAEVFAGLAQGSHAIYVHGRDAAGNWGPLASPVSFFKDTVAAAVTIAFPAANASYNAAGWTGILRGTVSDVAGSGLSQILVSVKDNATNKYWDGTAFTSDTEVLVPESPATAEWTMAMPVAALTSGHSYTVHAQANDIGGNTSDVSSGFRYDTTSPTTSAVVVAPNPTGAAPTVTATASDVASGNSTIAAAEFFIDTVGADGTGIAMTGEWTQPTANVSGTVSATVFAGLAEGSHTIYVHSRDAAGNWELATVSATFTKESGKPTTSAITVTPSPTKVSPAVSATVSDVASGNNNIVAAEFFIDTVGANGTGIAMTGDWTHPAGSVSGTMSAALFAGLAEGSHTIYVHGKDAAGNWGTTDLAQFVKDTLAPTVTLNAVTTPRNNTLPTFTGVAGHVGSDSSAVTIEIFSGTSASGIPVRTLTAVANSTTGSYSVVTNTALAAGTYTARAKQSDLTGNSGTSAATTFTIDTTGPTVVSVTSNLKLVSDANLGTGKLALTVTFSEKMDASVTPVLSFPTLGSNPTTDGSLSFKSGAWSLDNTTYTATYDVADKGLKMLDIDVGVSNAKDAAGNLQIGKTVTDVLSVDTLDPFVLSVTPSISMIGSGSAGTGKFTLTVVFNTAMDTSLRPTINFPTTGEQPVAMLVARSGVWANSTTYVATYDIVDQTLAMPAIDVQVAEAKDTAGHPLIVVTTADVFGINSVVAPATGSLSGYVYADTDNDGRNALVGGQRIHRGIAGATVMLRRTDKVDVVRYALTNSAGLYRFTDLPAGTYEVQEIQPRPYLDGKDTLGTIGGVANGSRANDRFFDISLATGANGTEYNFGERGEVAYGSSASRSFLALGRRSGGTVTPGLVGHTAPRLRLNGAAGRDYGVVAGRSGYSVAVANPQTATLSTNDGGALSSLVVRILNRPDGASEALMVDTSVLGENPRIKVSFANGVLTLSGVDLAANYQKLLRTVRYVNLADAPNPTPRRISFVANDSVTVSETAIALVGTGTAPPVDPNDGSDPEVTDLVFAGRGRWLGR